MSVEQIEFCDTNIFVYAYDASAGEKQETARRLLNRLWNSENGLLSLQVLQGLFVTLTRKLPNRLTAVDARQVVDDLSAWRIVELVRQDVLDAIDTSIRWQLSYWDALVLVAAKKGGATIIWSEDLKDGEDYDGVTVRNPFRP